MSFHIANSIRVCGLLLLVACVATAPCFADDRRTADPVLLEPPAIRIDSRLGISVQPADRGGLRVTAINGPGPTQQMQRAGDPNSSARLEVGDIILRVNGRPTNEVGQIHEILTGSHQQVELAVVDRRSGQTIQWIVRPFQVRVDARRPQIAANTSPALRAIIVADTDDPKLGLFAELSMRDLEESLTQYITDDRSKLLLLHAEQCTAQKLLQTVATLPANPSDAVLIYYLGHGAYDPRFAEDDHFGGHFLRMPGGDVLRRTLWAYLNEVPARLRMLVTDSCNRVAETEDLDRFVKETRTKQVEISGASTLERLFFENAGALDLNASGRDEYAWYGRIGGWFSHAFLTTVDDQALNDSEAFLQQLKVATQRVFSEQKQSVLETARADAVNLGDTLAKLRGQESLTATVFVKRMDEAPVLTSAPPPARRTVLIRKTVAMPVR